MNLCKLLVLILITNLFFDVCLDLAPQSTPHEQKRKHEERDGRERGIYK